MNDTRQEYVRGPLRGANVLDEHTAVERVSKKLLEMENNEKKYYAESRKKQNTDPYNITLRKKYNKIWRKLMDE